MTVDAPAPPRAVGAASDPDLGTDAASQDAAALFREAKRREKDAAALFREAKRRERRRRLIWLGASIAIVGAIVVGYVVARGSAPTRLLARPLHFPSIAPGEACPTTPGRPIDNSFFGGVALGSGPVRVLIANRGNLLRGHADLGTTGTPGWSALQTLWFATPGYNGPFIVRAKRLGASGPIEVQPGQTGQQPGSGPLIVPGGPTINTQDGYRTVPGSTWVTSPGCYAWQVDGRSFSEIVVVDALAHVR